MEYVLKTRTNLKRREIVQFYKNSTIVEEGRWRSPHATKVTSKC